MQRERNPARSLIGHYDLRSSAPLTRHQLDWLFITFWTHLNNELTADRKTEPSQGRIKDKQQESGLFGNSLR
ncbi:hypothetical protein GN956_G20886 [Arapaima gigas]